MTRRRLPWIDTSRGIAFAMVVYSHIAFRLPGLMHYFYPVFITLFFFVSGYLYNRRGKGFAAVAENRLRTLYIPFCIYGTLMVGMRYIFSYRAVSEPFWKAAIENLLQSGTNHEMWFVPCLFAYSLIFYPVSLISSRRWLAVSALLLYLTNWIADYAVGLPYFPFGLNNALYACAFMALGRWFALSDNNDSSRNPLILLLIIPYILLLPPEVRLNFTGCSDLAASVALPAIGLAVLIGISMLMGKGNGAISFIGRNSLIFFLLHGKVFALFQNTIAPAILPSHLLDNEIFFFFIGVAQVVFTLAILSVLTILINRWLPVTLGRGWKLWNTN